MSKNWYPVIDEGECIKCGICVEYCGSGVYDVEKAPAPLVINGNGCYEGCHGCGSLCPVGAITYFGDNTGWEPTKSKVKEKPDCGCGNNCDCGGNCG